MLWKQHCLFGALDSPWFTLLRHVAPKFFAQVLAVGSPRINPSGPVGSEALSCDTTSNTAKAAVAGSNTASAPLIQERVGRRMDSTAMTIRPLTSADFCWLLPDLSKLKESSNWKISFDATGLAEGYYYSVCIDARQIQAKLRKHNMPRTL